jgi:hypothetical protein
MHVGKTLCGMAKDSDCMNHEILLAQLHFYRIWWESENWFRSCLTNSRHKVEIKSPNKAQNVFSDWSTVKHGVPQASILGPPLFITYIYDLPLGINSVSEPGTICWWY